MPVTINRIAYLVKKIERSLKESGKRERAIELAKKLPNIKVSKKGNLVLVKREK